MRGKERQYSEPKPELTKSFKLSVSGLGEVIEIHYGDIVFEPPLEEVFQQTEGMADLKVLVSLTKDEYVVPNGSWKEGVFYAELVNRRPTIQVQKLVAALCCLDSNDLYPLHCGLTQPLNLDEKTIAFLGSSEAGKGTIISRLCGLSDPNTGQSPEAHYSGDWCYLAGEVLVFDSEKGLAYLIGKVRTRCLNFPEKHVIIEPGDVKTDGYPIGAFVLLDKNEPGSQLTRLKMPLDIPGEVISHSNIAYPIYRMMAKRPCLTITNIPVYKLGTKGNIPGTIEAINQIINQ